MSGNERMGGGVDMMPKKFSSLILSLNLSQNAFAAVLTVVFNLLYHVTTSLNLIDTVTPS